MRDNHSESQFFKIVSALDTTNERLFRKQLGRAVEYLDTRDKRRYQAERIEAIGFQDLTLLKYSILSTKESPTWNQ